MKMLVNTMSVLLLLIVTMSSCSDEGPAMLACDFDNKSIVLDPVCNFNPVVATTVSFPVWVLSDGVALHTSAYSFEWSSNPDFRGSAISVSYDQLPLTVTVTELSSDCVATTTLGTDFWD